MNLTKKNYESDLRLLEFMRSERPTFFWVINQCICTQCNDINHNYDS